MDQSLAVDSHQDDTFGELIDAAFELVSDSFSTLFKFDFATSNDDDKEDGDIEEKGSSSCGICKSLYTNTNQRKICHRCKNYICEDCSPNQMSARDVQEKVRICSNCFVFVQNKRVR